MLNLQNLYFLFLLIAITNTLHRKFWYLFMYEPTVLF
jgi:hypothetical protein